MTSSIIFALPSGTFCRNCHRAVINVLVTTVFSCGLKVGSGNLLKESESDGLWIAARPAVTPYQQLPNPHSEGALDRRASRGFYQLPARRLRRSWMLSCITTILVLWSTWATQANPTDPASTPSLPALEQNQLSDWNRSEFKFPDKRPYIALTDRAIAAAQQRGNQYRWASAILQDIMANANNSIIKPWPVTTRLDNPGQVDSAEELLAVARAYALNGKPPYAKWVCSGLLSYADVYPTLPVKNHRARFTLNSLSEAEWISPLAQAYDLVADCGQLTGNQKQHIENDLLRASVECFKIDDYAKDPRSSDLHFRCYNFQAWHIAAIGLVGLAVRDRDLVDYAVNSRYGLKHLVAHDIRDDGMFWERSQGYHRFVLQALLPFTEGMAHCGVDLYNLAVPSDNNTVEGSHYPTGTSLAPKSLRLMFEAPLYTAFPDLSCLAMGDSANKIQAGWIEQVAWSRCHSPVAACLLCSLDETSGRVGFLHYYRYNYHIENVSLNNQPIQWGFIDGTFRLEVNSVTADDGGQSQGDRFLLNDTDVSDFTLTWTMTHLQDFGSRDRAWLVFGAAPRGDPCKKISLTGRFPELNRPYLFELHVTGEKATLLRDGKEIPIQIDRGGGVSDVQALTAELPLAKDRAGAIVKVFGDGHFANTGVHQNGCSLFPSTGLVVLRQATGDFTRQLNSAAVALTYGSYGGGHGHPDKLGIAFYTKGRLWIPAFPSMPYETTWKKEWTSHTISQNTLVIDGVSQKPAGKQDLMWPVDSATNRVSGKLERFDPVIKLTTASSDTTYDGFRITRTVKLQGDCLIDRLSARPNTFSYWDYLLNLLLNLRHWLFRSWPHTANGRDHQFDSVLHIDGQFAASSLKFEPRPGTLGKICGYQHVKSLQTAMANGISTVTFKSLTQQQLKLWVVPQDAQPLELILAEGLTGSPVVTMPMFVLRTIGRSAKYLVIFEPLNDTNSITSLKLSKDKIIMARGIDEESSPIK